MCEWDGEIRGFKLVDWRYLCRGRRSSTSQGSGGLLYLQLPTERQAGKAATQYSAPAPYSAFPSARTRGYYSSWHGLTQKERSFCESRATRGSSFTWRKLQGRTRCAAKTSGAGSNGEPEGGASLKPGLAPSLRQHDAEDAAMPSRWVSGRAARWRAAAGGRREVAREGSGALLGLWACMGGHVCRACRMQVITWPW